IAESAAYAVLLWLLSQNFHLILDRCGIVLELPPPGPRAASIVTFVGAGIYEEVIFRLILFSGLVLMLRLVLFPAPVAVLIGGTLAAAAFAAAHHLGPYGEPY